MAGMHDSVGPAWIEHDWIEHDCSDECEFLIHRDRKKYKVAGSVSHAFTTTVEAAAPEEARHLVSRVMDWRKLNISRDDSVMVEVDYVGEAKAEDVRAENVEEVLIEDFSNLNVVTDTLTNLRAPVKVSIKGQLFFFRTDQELTSFVQGFLMAWDIIERV